MCAFDEISGFTGQDPAAGNHQLSCTIGNGPTTGLLVCDLLLKPCCTIAVYWVNISFTGYGRNIGQPLAFIYAYTIRRYC